MARLQRRRVLVRVGTVDVSELDLDFQITKTTKREPNTAEVRIFNLRSSTRSTLEGEEHPRLRVHAGYEDDGDPPPILFVGSARRLFTEVSNGTDLVTTVQASDGGTELRRARLSRSYAPGTPRVSALRDAVDALGIGRGNLAEFEAHLESRTFPDGYVADGPARRTLQTLVRSAGLRWSVQNGALQLMRSGSPLQDQAVLLSSSTGLVDSPTLGDRGKVNAQALIQPGLEPGRRVSLQSRAVEGGYEIRKVVYKGQTYGDAWYATLELAPL